jgi:hypothetical protein
MKAADAIVSILAGFIASPALSQMTAAEAELEKLGREVALDAAKFGVLRWLPKQFPLRVAFAFGENVGKTECAGQWRQKYEEYIQFINANGGLLIPTPTSKVVDAFVFFGSDAELDVLPAFGLQKAWMSKPGVSTQSQNLDRYNSSYSEAYGEGNFIEFSAVFQERTADGLLGCDEYASTRYLGVALLPSHIAFVSAQAERLFGGNPSPTLEWRAHRRLLAAMARLPEEALSSQLVKTFLIRELTND